jgi:hypothetical protein
MGGFALYRTQPGSCLPGNTGSGLAMVFCGCALRCRTSSLLAEYGLLGASMVYRWLARLLQATQDESSLLAIRDSTYSGRPLGSAEFTRTLEKEAHRPLTPQKRGPKKRTGPAHEQAIFSFDP